MNFSINDYINGIFKGIVFFIYSLVLSSVHVFASPTRFGLRLAKQSRHEGSGQINGYVILYAGSLILIVLLDFDFAVMDISVKLLQGMGDRGLFDTVHDEFEILLRALTTDRLFFHYLIPALLQVIFVDLSCRAISLTLLRREPDTLLRHYLFREMTFYSFGTIALLFVVISAILVVLSEYDLNVVGGTILALVTAVVYFIPRNIVPIARLFSRRAWLRTRRVVPTRILSTITSVALVAVCFGYLYIGISTTQKTTTDYSLYVPVVTAVECYIEPGPVLKAIVQIKNETDRPREIPSDSFELVLTSHSYNSTATVLSSSFGSNYDVYALDAGSSAWFYIQGDDTKTITDIIQKEPLWNGSGEKCFVETHSDRFAGNLYTNYRGQIEITDNGPIIDRRRSHVGSLFPSSLDVERELRLIRRHK